ncbi:unnamed protein product [Nesidiocoris tenuis]|uniref:G-protein coupled receptors family 1 profile domain-containing protein n=1 Tax=Nesidiocoris tenuis TaxID=355587 RepID=A0A6H5GXT9_9HEMI|nr:unnamed protein product [Nesidiocoris tenuis]
MNSSVPRTLLSGPWRNRRVLRTFVNTGPNLVSIFWNIIIGNLVRYARMTHRRMRTVTNYFLVNLSVSDLLMSLLNCIFNFTFMLDSHWPFGSVYCTVNNFVAHVSVASSVFTLVAISLDRYVAILRPLKHRMSRRKARVALVIIWAMSSLLALPCLLYSTTKIRSYRDGQTKTVCYMRWPDGHYPKSTSEHVFRSAARCFVAANSISFHLLAQVISSLQFSFAKAESLIYFGNTYVHQFVDARPQVLLFGIAQSIRKLGDGS